MAYASMALADADVRFPHVPMPRFRWPRLSRRARALLMMGIMISPAFLADDIGYCVQRLFLTADQIAVRQVPDQTMLSRVNIFHVACIDPNVPAAERGRLAGFATQQGWPRYPEAGPGCFNPDRNLFGIVGLKAFNIACPTMAFSVTDQRRWVAFAANHGWTAYPQAGEGCVDP
ncbi:MAG TPA: hypothetical protein VIY55_04880 [Acetobacteraceae bacterium]|jgi:hypothetical protein